MSNIHPTAIVETTAIGRNVSIGAYCIIGKDVDIEDDVVIHSHVVIQAATSVGAATEIFSFAVIGKEPKGAGALARQPVFNPHVRIGESCSIGPHAVIYCDVDIGNNCLVGDAASIREQTRIGDRTVVGRHVTVNYKTNIGARTKIMDHAWIAGNANIGNDVFISGGVLTSNDNTPRAVSFDDARMIGPTIEDGVLIGLGAIILPAIRIGKNAIVAAGAIVTKDVPAEGTVMGAAARLRQ
jgi:acyl-[acyl carrier protein]--UDP-N-acetylglucosamine O-acyltransferase